MSEFTEKLMQEIGLGLGHTVKEQWQKLINATNKYPKYETVRIPLTKISIDSKSVYLFLKEFSTMLNDNPNLFTMIHDGNNILRAYAEGTKDGVYDSLAKIELDGWEKSAPLHDIKATFEYAKLIAKEKTGIDIGLLKMGHVSFFKEFYPVFDEEKSNLESICHMYECTRNALHKNLIAFYPEPKLFKFLRETKDIELKPEFLEKSIEKHLPNTNYGLLIKTSEGLIGATISKHDKNLYIEFPRTETDQLDKKDLKSLTAQYRKKLGLKMAIGLEAKALKDVANELANYSLKDKETVNEIVKFVKKGYEKNIYVSIHPAIDSIDKHIKHTPAFIMKRAGYRIQKHVFK